MAMNAVLEVSTVAVLMVQTFNIGIVVTK